MSGIDSQAETARVALGLARQEIVVGQTVRTGLIGIYIIFVLIVFAAAVAADTATEGIVYGLLPGIAAVMTALVVAHVTEAIDYAVGCVRFSINPFLMNCDAWAPHPDWFSGRAPFPMMPGQRPNGPSEAEIARGRFTAFSFLIHVPSVFSVVWSSYMLFSAVAGAPLGVWAFWVLSIAGILGALLVTLRLAGDRARIARTLGDVVTPPSFAIAQRRAGA